uniref:Type I restriction modification DNA specificity domain-containing protein n=1 Tax=Arsenophonus endosymbiont of Trialeurodes vaporariorum TaxID=235567 RepID=A0A3B0MFS4_9GAMM
MAPKYINKLSDQIVINQKCIRNGKVYLSDAKYHTPGKKCKDSSVLLNGDILINSTGTGTLGRAGIWFAPYEKTYFVDTHVTRLFLKNGGDLSGFLVEYFNTEFFQKQLYSECVSGSTNQIELNKNQLSELKVPTLEGQQLKDVLELLSILDSTICAIDEKLLSIILLKKNIQQKYWG